MQQFRSDFRRGLVFGSVEPAPFARLDVFWRLSTGESIQLRLDLTDANELRLEFHDDRANLFAQRCYLAGVVLPGCSWRSCRSSKTNRTSLPALASGDGWLRPWALRLRHTLRAWSVPEATGQRLVFGRLGRFQQVGQSAFRVLADHQPFFLWPAFLGSFAFRRFGHDPHSWLTF